MFHVFFHNHSHHDVFVAPFRKDTFDSLVLRMESSASGRSSSQGLVRSSSQYLDENGLTHGAHDDLTNPYDQYESEEIDDLSIASQVCVCVCVVCVCVCVCVCFVCV